MFLLPRLKSFTRSNLPARKLFSPKFNSLSSAPQEEGFFKDEMAELKTYYPLIVQDLTDTISQYKQFPGLLERFPVLMDYTVTHDDPYFLSSAVLPLYFYKAVEESDKLTEENIKRACLMSWAYRTLETSQIIVDDILDKSEVRYSKPAWYKKDGVSMELTILDSHYLATGAYMVLTKRLAGHPCCLDIVDLYAEGMFVMIIAQYMDIKKVNVKDFLKLIRHRFDKALYVFNGSVRSGLYLANIKDRETHDRIKKFSVPMSRFFQVQNDFSGVFEDESKFQNSCPDIVNGRNSWLVTTALKMANPAQRKVIEENYGNGDPESARKVMQIYEDLTLKEVHDKRTEEFLKEMYEVVENFPDRIPKQPFHDIVQQLALNKLYF
uniref:Terpene synthase n=1 Tax=Phyllotreta armoraciae TaxID=1553667 RepID=A0A140AZ64_9CUCU|nr:terpene synthase [Phyllotreta armoraciae]